MVKTESKKSLKKRLWEIVEVAEAGDKASKIFDISILILIFFNVVAVILGSVKAFEQAYSTEMYYFELISVIVFTTEYLIRLWSCVESERFKGSITGRLKFAFQFMSIIDLLAVLPFYLPFTGIDLRYLRMLRLFRILRIAKLGRYYSSLQLIKQVVYAKKEELIMTSAVMGLLLIFSSSVIYYIENPVQPDSFSSIPATMWWAVATLTTVGYGDMLPITPIGRFFASIISILGIGMFALPTGILGAGFVEEIKKSKGEHLQCPHCGKKIDL